MPSAAFNQMMEMEHETLAEFALKLLDRIAELEAKLQALKEEIANCPGPHSW